MKSFKELEPQRRAADVFKVNTAGYSFIHLGELYEQQKGEPVRVDGLFVTNGKYGKQGIAINTDRQILIPLPGYKIDAVISILNDAELVDLIKAGKCALRIYEYQSKAASGRFYGVQFIDI